MQRLKIPVVFMRGGTSKGLFFHEKALPADATLRDRFLLSAMSSPDRYGRQLNGMGGGISSLSKVIVVRPSTHPDADIDYLHGQVAVDRPFIDYSANFGNLSSAVGAFALDEGSVPHACARGIAGPAVRVGTPSGVLTVGAVLEGRGTGLRLDHTIVYSTARRLMEGKVHGTI